MTASVSAIGSVERNHPIPLSQVALLASLGALGPLSIDMYLPTLPLIGADIGSGAGDGQQTLATYFAGLAIGQLVAGPLSDRFGRIRPLAGGLAIYLVGSLGCALAGSMGMLMLWRFVQALGGSAAMVIPRAVIRDRQTGNAAARTAALLALVGGMAPVVAPLLGGQLIGLGWRSIFTFLCVLGLLLLWGVPRALHRPPVEGVLPTIDGAPAAAAVAAGADAAGTASTTPPPISITPRAKGLWALFADLKILLSDGHFLRCVLGSGCASAAMFAYITGSPFVIITLHGVAPSHFGWFFAINVSAMITAAQLNRLLLRRWPLTRVLASAGWLGAAGGALLITAAATGLGGLPAIVASAFAIMFSMGFIGTNAAVLALEHHGQRAGMASALMGCLQFTVAATASSLVGLLHNGTALPMALVMGGMITLSALILGGGPLLVTLRGSGRFARSAEFRKK